MSDFSEFVEKVKTIFHMDTVTSSEYCCNRVYVELTHGSCCTMPSEIEEFLGLLKSFDFTFTLHRSMLGLPEIVIRYNGKSKIPGTIDITEHLYR